MLISVEGSASMGVTVTSSDPERGGRPEWPDGPPELVSGEGIFVETLRHELAGRGISRGSVRLAGHAGEADPLAQLTTRPV